MLLIELIRKNSEIAMRPFHRGDAQGQMLLVDDPVDGPGSNLEVPRAVGHVDNVLATSRAHRRTGRKLLAAFHATNGRNHRHGRDAGK